jgi:hypothetical protein
MVTGYAVLTFGSGIDSYYPSRRHSEGGNGVIAD